MERNLAMAIMILIIIVVSACYAIAWRAGKKQTLEQLHKDGKISDSDFIKYSESIYQENE